MLPPAGRRFILTTVDILDKDRAIVAWQGRTWQYRERFNLLAISCEDDVRFLADGVQRDMTSDENRRWVLDIFGHSVLKDAVTYVTIKNEDAAVEGSATRRFLDDLKALPQAFTGEL
eukprot:439181-Heterocapsa_arctica.AAC.1